MKKNRMVIIAFLCILFILSACLSSLSSTTIKAEDIVTVYDSEDKELIKFTSQEDLTYFSELVGYSVKNINKDNAATLYVDVPKDAKISFRYAFTHTKENGGRTTVNFFVYENYPYITLKGIPVVSPLTWELSEEDNYLLQNPMEYGK